MWRRHRSQNHFVSSVTQRVNSSVLCAFHSFSNDFRWHLIKISCWVTRLELRMPLKLLWFMICLATLNVSITDRCAIECTSGSEGTSEAEREREEAIKPKNLTIINHSSVVLASFFHFYYYFERQVNCLSLWTCGWIHRNERNIRTQITENILIARKETHFFSGF